MLGQVLYWLVCVRVYVCHRAVQLQRGHAQCLSIHWIGLIHSPTQTHRHTQTHAHSSATETRSSRGREEQSQGWMDGWMNGSAEKWEQRMQDKTESNWGDAGTEQSLFLKSRTQRAYNLPLPIPERWNETWSWCMEAGLWVSVGRNGIKKEKWMKRKKVLRKKGRSGYVYMLHIIWNLEKIYWKS